jgi:hypothetical protein
LILGPPAIAVNNVMTDRENAYIQRVNAATDLEKAAEDQASRDCTTPATCRAALDTLLNAVNKLASAAANPPALCACAKWGNDIVEATGYYQRGLKMVEAGIDNSDQTTYDAGWQLVAQGDSAMNRSNADRDAPASSPTPTRS